MTAGNEDLITVAVVEDHPLFARAVADRLNAQRPRMCCVGVAPTPEEAVQLVTEHTPDITLVDLQLQGDVRRGLELVARLTDIAPSTKVVVLTAFDSDEHIFLTFRAGAVGFLHKEKVDDKALIAHIENVYSGDIEMSPGIAERVIGYFRIKPNLERVGYQRGEALTPREKEVLGIATQGLTNREIAEELGISWRTVKVHISNILDKLRLASRYELWLYHMQNGVGDSTPGSGGSKQ